MGSNPDFSKKRCLVVTENVDLARLVLHSLRQIGLMDAHRAKDVRDAINQLYQVDFDILICASLGISNYLEILKTIRFELHWSKSKIPVACFEQNWTTAVAGQLRDSGVTLRGTLPFSLSGLLKALTNCFKDSRAFISIPNFRGPDRRLPTPPDYSGPRRRAADAANLGEVSKGQVKTSRLVQPPQSVKPAQLAKPTAKPGMSSVAGFAPPLREQSSEQYVDPAMQQTKVVIEDAHLTINQVSTLSHSLRSAKTSANRADLLQKIAGTSERFVNLLTLALSRIEAHGCDEHLLDRLGKIKESIAANTEELAEAAARQAIDYGQKILSKSRGFPLGAGEFITQQIVRMETLIQIIGGVDQLSDEMQKIVAEANQILKKVIDKENKISCVLSEVH